MSHISRRTALFGLAHASALFGILSTSLAAAARAAMVDSAEPNSDGETAFLNHEQALAGPADPVKPQPKKPKKSTKSKKQKKTDSERETDERQKKEVDDLVEGRPFYVLGHARTASLGDSAEWADSIELDGATLTPKLRAVLSQHYTRWALAEHASIASFARFGLQLLALGAPPSLLLSTAEAMADEARHARFGFGLVRALTGELRSPDILNIEHALAEDNTAEGVLALVAREGLIGETLAALEVRAAAELAESVALRQGLAVIAEEETRHAALAYSFAAWLIGRSPELVSVLEREVLAWRSPTFPSLRGLSKWGILDRAKRSALMESGFRLVVLPLMAKLIGRPLHVHYGQG